MRPVRAGSGICAARGRPADPAGDPSVDLAIYTDLRPGAHQRVERTEGRTSARHTPAPVRRLSIGMRWGTMPAPFPLMSRGGGRAGGCDEGPRRLKGADEHTPRACERAAERAEVRMTARGERLRGAACPADVHPRRLRCIGEPACAPSGPRSEVPAGDRAGRDARLGAGRSGGRVRRPGGLRRPNRTTRIGFATPTEAGRTSRRHRSLGAGRYRRFASPPVTDVFELRDDACRCAPRCTMRSRLAVGADATLSWRRDVDTDGRVIGLDDFGAADLKSAAPRTVWIQRRAPRARDRRAA